MNDECPGSVTHWAVLPVPALTWLGVVQESEVHFYTSLPQLRHSLQNSKIQLVTNSPQGLPRLLNTHKLRILTIRIVLHHETGFISLPTRFLYCQMTFWMMTLSLKHKVFSLTAQPQPCTAIFLMLHIAKHWCETQYVLKTWNSQESWWRGRKGLNRGAIVSVCHTRSELKYDSWVQ